jgi:hypothetical protein
VSSRHRTYVVGVKRGVLGQYRPQNPCVLVGKRHDRLLPAHALLELYQPYADAIGLFGRAHDGRHGSLDDREADLFELFALAREPATPRLLVRASQNRQRRVATEAAEEPFWAHVQGLPVAGRTRLNIPRRGARRAREALVSLRFAPVRVSPPKDTAGVPVDLWAVHRLEQDPPESIEPAA